MMKLNPMAALLLLLLASACEKVGQNEWSDIDYSKIARDNYYRQNDANYTAPNVLGCVDDDLINCRTRGRTYYGY